MTASPSSTTGIRLGLRENLAQFTLLVIVNAFVGAMVGLERSILPAIAEQEFHLVARTAVLSFIVVFGVAKALSNYGAGRLSDRWGRKHVLVAGWLVAVPVPFLLMWAPAWNWVLFANVLLGISQGLTWSTTVIMKIDLVGPRERGLAMGLNEFAGYGALAVSALATGWIAARYGIRPQPFYLGVGFAVVGLALSALLVRETRHHVSHESALVGTLPSDGVPTPREVFWRTTLVNPDLSSVSQTGLVNNLNDGMAWGLFPLVFAAAGLNLAQVGLLAAIYPATWSVVQIATGALSDRTGRKPLIVWGMWIQAAGIALVTVSSTIAGFVVGALLLGIGTAMVYPALLAAIGDVAHPSWRASAVGVYRLWRDLGYAIGALLAGLIADAFGLQAAMWSIAALTFASGTVSALRMTETLPARSLTRSTAEELMSTQIEAPMLRDWLDAHEPVTVVDIRTDDDYAQWAIPGSVHVNAYEALRNGEAGALANLTLPIDRPVVTVCNAGKVSQTAADVLAKRGFDARSLAGGMKAWSLAWNAADVCVADPSVQVVQVRRTGKGCLSYLIGSAGDAAVIDPSVVPDVYVAIARRHGWSIQHVIETHIHADHLSRAGELARQTGATLRLPAQHRARFTFTPIVDEESIRLGQATLRALATPGHTQESMSYVLNDVAVFTGDTLFTNGVGRPDLHTDPDAARHRARALFASLARLQQLSPDLLVLPAHTSEPIAFDGRAVVARLDDVATWLSRWVVSEAVFVERLTSNLPPTPPNFVRIVELNEAGEFPTADPTDLEAGANRCAVR